jgi:hypothetical protein
MSPNPIFHTPDTLRPQRIAMADRAMNRFPGKFPTQESALDFLSDITMPASGRWAYIGNAKTGTSSTKRFLFQLEFGVPLSVSYEPRIDVNTDAVSHALARSGVFRALPNIASGLNALNKSLRLATARHPVARALSSFNYLSLTDAECSPWLAIERIRMNATVGFDWTKDRYTHDGFIKFLNHLAENERRTGDVIDDPHLRPQVRNVRPDIYRPDLIGRTENLPAFFCAVAERLDTPLPDNLADLPSNQQDVAVTPDALLSKDSKRLMAEVFAADFDWLNEDVDSWKP